MQEPGVGTGGAAGGGGEEGERRGQNSYRAPEDQRSPGRSSAGEGRSDDEDDVREPRGAQDPGNEAAAGDPDEGGPVQQGGPGEGAAAAPQGAQAPLASGPSGDASSGTRSHLSKFFVMLHFHSPLEADIARRTFIINARRQEARVQQEFRVNDSAVAVSWMSEDPLLLETTVSNFIDQLSLLMRTIQLLTLAASVQRSRG